MLIIPTGFDQKSIKNDIKRDSVPVITDTDQSDNRGKKGKISNITVYK